MSYERKNLKELELEILKKQLPFSHEPLLNCLIVTKLFAVILEKEIVGTTLLLKVFLGTLKSELIYRMRLKNMEQTSNAVFEYIECWYNKKRRHSALENLNIDEFWMKYYEKINIKLVA